MTREELHKLNIPDSPGVYFFRDGRRKILYIGKAASLRDRTKSYFTSDLAAGRGQRIVAMVASAQSLSWQETGSVLEALILEANLIKRHQPPYNVDEKDNTSFNYLVITREEFPALIVMRGRELFGVQAKDKKLKAVFGPFPQGGSLKEALKIVRKIFPYRDEKCIPCGTSKNKTCKPCFNRQIGLCPGVCTGEISTSEYGLVIRNLMQLFSGNFKGLKRDLARQMKAAAKAEEFEQASHLHRQVEALEHIRDVSLIKDEHRVHSGGGTRIEAYDVAHTAGVETVAVMTVISNGEPVKAAYRKFTIRTVTNNDVAALSETLTRRLNHPEWPLPRVFVVDGGKAQMNAARKILRKAGIEIAIVGVVKDEHHRPKALIGDERAVKAHEKDILLANNEAHRFAINWHRTRLRRAVI